MNPPELQHLIRTEQTLILIAVSFASIILAALLVVWIRLRSLSMSWPSRFARRRRMMALQKEIRREDARHDDRGCGL
jgi:hypothetical protein